MRQCNRCLMDETAQPIIFDAKGNCNYCEEFLEDNDTDSEVDASLLPSLVNEIKRKGKNKKYDCIIGVSGGVDSSFVLLQAVTAGLRPLAVHLDNGWNSDLAVTNIDNLTTKLGVDLYTHVIDWDENRDLQLSFFQAHVVDIELLMDNAMLALNYRMAIKYNLKYILSGSNTATEGVKMPKNWNWLKYDSKNIRAIHRKYGSKKIKTHKLISVNKFLFYKFILKIDWVSFLDYQKYHKESALKELEETVDYRRYPYKHYESIFTRFYQGYILPKKFNIDKRKLHLSNLILTDQMRRDDAVDLLRESPYPSFDQFQTDYKYVLKKLGLDESYFSTYLKDPRIEHSAFSNSADLWEKMKTFYTSRIKS